MRNPPALLSSKRIRSALVTAKHVSDMEMGDAIEAYVVPSSSLQSRRTSWSCCTVLLPVLCSPPKTRSYRTIIKRTVSDRVWPILYRSALSLNLSCLGFSRRPPPSAARAAR